MSRYNLHIETAAGSRILDRRYRVEITVAGSGVVATATDLSYTVTEADTMPGTSGWGDGPLVGFPDARTRRMTLALNRLPDTLAAALVSPLVADAGEIVIGSYSRTYDLVNVVAVYSDRNPADPATPLPDTTTLEELMVQRPIPTQSGVAGPQLVTLELDLVDAAKWILETMTVADIEAATFDLSAGTTHRWLYQDVWSDGTRTYTVRHGDSPLVSLYRQYTVHTLADIFAAVEVVGAQMMTQLTRRAGGGLGFVDGVNVTSDTRAHWTLYPPNGGTNGLHDTTAWGGDRLLCTRIALNDTPTLPFHGFLASGLEDPPEDTLASWKTVWDWIADEARAAGCVPLPTYLGTTSIGAVIVIKQMAEPKRIAGVSTYAALGPAAFQDPNVPFEIGAGQIARASYVTPNATSNDAEPVDLPSGWGAAGDESWSVPRGFHTNPIAWPTDDRHYYVSNLIGGAGAGYANVDVITQAFNCLTIYHLSDVGGLLSAAAPVRLHSYCECGIWGSGVSSDQYTDGLPAPNPVDDYQADEATGDTDLGTPYLVSVARRQRESGAPRAAAKAVMYIHGNPPMVTYKPTVRTSALQGELSNVVDPALFPSGNALLDGATFFGALPGNPHVKAIEDDLMGRQLATVTLVGIP